MRFDRNWPSDFSSILISFAKMSLGRPATLLNACHFEAVCFLEASNKKLCLTLSASLKFEMQTLLSLVVTCIYFYDLHPDGQTVCA